MENTREINGKIRRIFTLAGFEYSAPLKVGGGYRDAVGQIQIQFAMDEPIFGARLAAVKSGPNATEEFMQIIKDFSKAYPGKYKLSVILGLLKPIGDAPATREAIEELYMEEASQEEGNAIANFFSESVRDKTGDESLKTESGKSMAPKKRKSR